MLVYESIIPASRILVLKNGTIHTYPYPRNSKTHTPMHNMHKSSLYDYADTYEARVVKF
jgi:hypothetical protein